MHPQPPFTLDYAQVAATADEETAALLAAIDFRKPVSQLLHDDEAAARIAAKLPTVFNENYGRPSCTGSCVNCRSQTPEVLTIGWQCHLVSWRMKRIRYANVESACSMCPTCADLFALRLVRADRVIWTALAILGTLAVLALSLGYGWMVALLIAIGVSVAMTRYGTVKGTLPDELASRFPIWIRWVSIRGYTLPEHPLNRINMDFSKPEN